MTFFQRNAIHYDYLDVTRQKLRKVFTMFGVKEIFLNGRFGRLR